MTTSDELSIRTEVAALIMVDGVIDTINATATTWVKDRLAQFDADFKLTTGPTKAAWMRVKEMASDQEQTGIELPTTDQDRDEGRQRASTRPTCRRSPAISSPPATGRSR